MAFLPVIFSIVLNILLVQGNQDGSADITFDITCHESKMDAVFTVIGTEANLKFAKRRDLYVELLDKNCNSQDSQNRSTFYVDNGLNTQAFDGTYNVTVNITFDYDECSTTLENTTNKIIAKNTAVLKVTDTLREGRTKRDYYYEYNINCELLRDVKKVTSHGYVVNYNVTNITRTAERTENYTMDINMAFYTDANYNVMQPAGQLTVNTNQFIYTKIMEAESNTNFKFIVNQCSAGKDMDPNHADNDIFFQNKCSLDSTFDASSMPPHAFAFKIQAFNYLEENLAVYFHCNIYICKEASTIEECTQICQSSGGRFRRDADPVDMRYEEVTLTSGKIVFNNRVTCNDLSCGDNSKCRPLEPAQCICNEGYVFSEIEKVCVTGNQFKIGKLRLLQEWKPIYSDVTSIEFLQLAHKHETLLLKMLKATDGNKDIHGVKVTKAIEGSVVLEVVVLHSPLVTPRAAYQTFLTALTEDDLRSTTAKRDLKLSKDVTPTFMADVKEAITDIQKIILVITIVVLLLVIFVAGILIFKIRKSRRSATKDVTSFDNKGVAISNLS